MVRTSQAVQAGEGHQDGQEAEAHDTRRAWRAGSVQPREGGYGRTV